MAQRGFFRTTVVGGILFLVPVVAIIAIVEKALGLLDRLAVPLARWLAVRDVAGVPAPRLLAVLLLVLICFLAGLFARTRIARRFVDSLEARVLSNIPGYSFLKSLGASFAGMDDGQGGSVILVRIEDAWQIGFLMERMGNGEVVVFVPGAPGASSGSVYFMAPDRIRPLDVPMSQAVSCLRRLGRGSAALIRT
jgi:uncharacterized membrane protein